MKTAPFLALVLSLPATAAYAQASADAAAQTTGSVQTMGHDAAVSQASHAAANGSATGKSLAGSANESATVAGRAGKAGASAMQASNVSAELAQKIDSKNAKVGDEVIARTTSNAQLQGAKLPKGTRLMGKVTEVQAKSREQHDGRLAFTFDRAVLRDGREIPIHAMLQSISAPASAAAMADASDDFATGGGPVMANGGGSAHAGGLLGGGGGAVAGAGGLMGGATSAVGSASGRVVGATDATLRTGAGVVSQTGASAVATVHNLPGVTATASASGGAMLQGSGRNVELSGGTQLVLGVSEN